MSSTILVTGGAGYIGSHTVLQLLLGGYKAVVVDNLDNSSEISLKRVQELAGKQGSNLTFHKVFYLVKTAFLFHSYLGFWVLIEFFGALSCDVIWGLGGLILCFSYGCTLILRGLLFCD